MFEVRRERLAERADEGTARTRERWRKENGGATADPAERREVMMPCRDADSTILFSPASNSPKRSMKSGMIRHPAGGKRLATQRGVRTPHLK